MKLAMKIAKKLSVEVAMGLSVWILAACSGIHTTTESEGQCYLSDGREADCATGLAKPGSIASDPTTGGRRAENCGSAFRSTFEAMLSDESSLDGWILHCESFECPSTVKAQIRGSAEALLRSSATLQRSFPSAVCRGTFQGGNKSVEGEFSSGAEASRAQAKAQRYLYD